MLCRTRGSLPAAAWPLALQPGGNPAAIVWRTGAPLCEGQLADRLLTDFADRLEREIIPALKAGFIVLADRYIFTAIARARVRGVDRAWLRSLYGFAIAPHLVFYLKIDVDTLTRRVLESRGMDFWESGMDLKLADDIYDSFRTYQGKLLREYWAMADEFGFRVVDARQPVDRIQQELRRQIDLFLGAEAPAAAVEQGPKSSAV